MLQTDAKGVHFIEIGVRLNLRGETVPKRFVLGTSRARARRVAVKLIEIWKAHGEVWTRDAKLEAQAALDADPTQGVQRRKADIQKRTRRE